GKIRVFETSSGQELFVTKDVCGPITWVSRSLDNRLVTIADDKNISWVFDSTGKKLFVIANDKITDDKTQSRVYNANGEELFVSKDDEKRFDVIGSSPDGKLFIISNDKFENRIWNADTGVEVFKPRGATETVTAVKFSADGRLVATFNTLSNIGRASKT